MNVTCFLAVMLLCLVIYVVLRDLIVNRKRNDGSKKAKNTLEDFASLDLPHKIEFFSKAIALALFAYLYLTHFSFVVAVFSIPGLIAYTLVLILTLATTWKVIKSSCFSISNAVISRTVSFALVRGQQNDAKSCSPTKS